MPAIGYTKCLARICRESFYEFFKEFWLVVAEERFRDNWHVEKLCAELQELSERVFADKPKSHDLAWNCPPGTTKSKVASVLWNAWIWTRMPSARFLSGSYSERISHDLSRQTRDCIISQKYKDLFHIELRKDQDTKGYFMNTRGGWRFATGVGGTATGMHAHFLCIDDPIDPLSSLSDILAEEANTWISETLGDRKVEKWLTPTALIMQRLRQNDPTGHWLEINKKLRHRCIPAEDSYPIVPPEWVKYYKDGLLDPIRLPREVLEEAAGRGEAYYAGQYGQQPVPRGGAMFKTDLLNYITYPPRTWKRGPVRYWDKAVSLKKRGSWTVGTKMALDFDERVWILDVKRGRWNTADRERMIQSTAKADGKSVRIVMEQEPGAGGKESVDRSMATLNSMGFRATADKVGTDKYSRADPFSVQVNNGNVILIPGVWNKEFLEEMRFFPQSRFTDQVDSASGAYANLAKARLVIGAL